MKINLNDQYDLLNQHENEAYLNGYKFILGIDEVGRGPLAGPVVVAGVVLDPQVDILGIYDSKKISESKREELSSIIKEKCIHYEIVEIDSRTIDNIGISNCIRHGVDEIIKRFVNKKKVDFVLIDYMKVEIDLPHKILKKGDQISNSIAAASIIAKVYRDQHMKNLALKYPNYDFEKHKGYGTRTHIEKIISNDTISGVHRTSFEPIKSKIKKG